MELHVRLCCDGASDSTLRPQDCTFDSSQAEEGIGGAVYMDGSALLIASNTTFAHGQALAGGAMFSTDAVRFGIVACTVATVRALHMPVGRAPCVVWTSCCLEIPQVVEVESRPRGSRPSPFPGATASRTLPLISVVPGTPTILWYCCAPCRGSLTHPHMRARAMHWAGMQPVNP